VKGSKRLKCGRGKMEAFVLNKYIAEKGSITCTSYEILISCNMRFSVDKMFLLTFKKYCFERFIQALLKLAIYPEVQFHSTQMFRPKFFLCF